MAALQYSPFNTWSAGNFSQQSPISFNTGRPVFDSFASGMGSVMGSSWDNLKGGFDSFTPGSAGNYQPLNYDLSAGLSSPTSLTNSNNQGGFNLDFGNWNLQGMGNLLGGLGGLASGLGGIYMGLQANKLANKQFNFMKDMANTQLSNSIKEYNTKLAGKYRSQSYYETGQDHAFDDLYEKNKLTR